MRITDYHRRVSFATVLLVIACASGGGDGSAARSAFRRDVGVATSVDLFDKTMKLLGRYQFEIRRRESSPEILIETEWKARNALEDERLQGVVAAENRIFINGRARSTTGNALLYNVDLTIENRVRSAEGEWNEQIATPMYRAYADQITQDLKKELTIGVRKY